MSNTKQFEALGIDFTAEVGEVERFLKGYADKRPLLHILRNFKDFEPEITKAIEPEQSETDFPEYEPIARLFATLTDREKVLIEMLLALMGADNFNTDSGKYLRGIFDKQYNAEYSREVLKTSKDAEIIELARLAGTIAGLC